MGFVTEKCKTLEEAKEKWEEVDLGLSKNIIGQKNNHLTILYRTKSESKRTYYVAQCDCEDKTLIRVRADHWKSGHTQSCGCHNHKQIVELGQKSAIDITGQRFGKLVALKPTDKRDCGSIVWECQCDCGNLYYTSVSDLNYLHTLSCPKCKVKSAGELKIKEILEQNNILYEKEKNFETCKFPDSNCYGYFDFYIDNKYLIEFDGEQHFKPSRFVTNITVEQSQKNLKRTQQRDEFKNQWCKDNNIPLIRIPYTHLQNLCLEDLLLETSKFIIK